MKMETEFRVFTLNCWAIKYISKDVKKRIEALIEKFNNSEYDFVFLQEIWSLDDYGRIAKKVSNVLPFSHYFHSGVIGSGMCILSKAPIIETFYHQWALNGYIHKLQHGDWFGGKGVGLCKVLYKGLFLNLIIAHLHAEYDSKNDEYIAHRVIQAFDTAQLVKLISKGSDATILAGDLNTLPDSLPFKIFCEVGNLIDTYSTDCPKKCSNKIGGTCETPENSYTPVKVLEERPYGMRIDFILFSSNGKTKVDALSYDSPLESRVHKEQFSYSDHEAVSAKFKIIKSDQLDSNIEQPVRITTIEEGIRICDEALRSLTNNKIFYIIGCIICFTIILVTIPFQHYQLVWLPYLLLFIRIICISLSLFCILMATFWNRMETNGIREGRNGMIWVHRNLCRGAGNDGYTSSPMLYPISMEEKH